MNPMIINSALIASVLFAYQGMLLLCMSMERHYKQMHNQTLQPSRKRILRSLGWLFLLLSFAASLQAWPPAMGAVAWFGIVSMAGFTLLMALPYYPKATARAGMICWPVGLTMMFLNVF